MLFVLEIFLVNGDSNMVQELVLRVFNATSTIFQLHLWSQVFSISYMTGSTSVARTTYPSRAYVSSHQILVWLISCFLCSDLWAIACDCFFYVFRLTASSFFRVVEHCMSFGHCIYCLYLRLLIISLVSSNSPFLVQETGVPTVNN